jgi:hypothetical protein
VISLATLTNSDSIDLVDFGLAFFFVK